MKAYCKDCGNQITMIENVDEISRTNLLRAYCPNNKCKNDTGWFGSKLICNQQLEKFTIWKDIEIEEDHY